MNKLPCRPSAPENDVLPELQPGCRLQRGRFTIVAMRGRGGRGRVYEAFDSRMGQSVALKVPRRSGQCEHAHIQREFAHLAAISHPNVVRGLEVFEEECFSFFSMELVRGIEFQEHVRRDDGGILDCVRLRSVFAGLANGVSAVHHSGRVHGDLKSNNVLIEPSGRVVVVDFGIAFIAGERVDPQVASAGTPANVAPEVLARVPASFSSDAYSTGVMLYEALTDRLPFEGAPHEIMFAKQWFNPPTPRSLKADVPSDLSEFCMRLLSRDPAARPRLDGLEIPGIRFQHDAVSRRRRPRAAGARNGAQQH